MMTNWGFASPFHFLIPILILVLTAGALVLFARSVSGTGGAAGERRPSALETLAERYARGEIDRDEYLQRKADIAR